MTTAEHICKNCGHSFTGNHCNICGQKIAHRLDTKHIVHEAVHVFTHADKGIFPLVPMILFRPGTLALQYVEGKRKRYFSIFQYLILIVGIITFIMSKLHWMENVMHSVNPDVTKSSARVLAVQSKIMSTLQHYFNLFLFALIPVFSFFSWLFFKPKGYNYAENFVLQAAIQAQISTYSLCFILPLIFLFGKGFHGIVIALSLLLLLTCNTIANRQFFKVSAARAFFKGLAIYICTNIVQVIVIAIVILILVLQYKK
jgi:hypothetical protein